MDVLIDGRFNGPPTTANGGYAAGTLAAFVDGAAETTLHRPPPLGEPMTVSTSGDTAALRLGDDLIASARTVTLEASPVPAVTVGEARTAAERGTGIEHPWFAGCFVCGHDRPDNDGLALYPGIVEGTDLLAAPWTPRDDVAAPDGAVPDEIVWAALDCPSGYAAMHAESTLALLGRMAARIDSPVEVGRTYVATARALGRDGRKLFATSSLHTASGVPVAVATTTWIAVDLES